MIWSILIASHSSRTEKLVRLASMLESQLTDGVEVVVFWNRGRVPGELREALCADARGEYVSHVDDDDRVAETFITDVLTALETKPDYVGFDVEVWDIAGNLGAKGKRYIAEHSLKHAKWHQRGDRFYRHVSHLNPIRRDLALKAEWPGSNGEDHRWADKVRPYVKTEVYVPKVLYFYDFDHLASLRGNNHDPEPCVRPVLPAGFRYHPQSEV